MSKLIKQLKPFTLWIIIIFALLYAQAMADLSLPGYMADIVNVGIQQNGVENAVPEAISTESFGKLTLFMSEDEKTRVTNDYILLDRQTLSEEDYSEYLEEYPALADTTIQKLDTDSKDEIEWLDGVFTGVIPIVYGIESGNLSGLGGEEARLPEGVDPFAVISSMSSDQVAAMIEVAEQQVTALPPDMLKQFSTVYISTQYEAIGMDLGRLRTSYMLHTGLLMLLITLGAAACSVTVGFIASRLAAGLGRNMRKQLFERVESFSNAEFDTFSTASLITRSTNDITQVQMLMVMLFRIVFYAPILGIGGVIKVIGADQSMLWIIGAAVGSVLTLILVMMLIALPKFQIIQTLVDKLNLVTREILSGLMVIRAFNTQDYEEKRFDQANVDLTKISLFINRVLVFLMPAMMLIMNGVMLLIIWVGSHQIDAGAMQVGDMMAFMQYAMQIIMAFLMVSIVFIMLPRAIVSAERISEVLETEPVVVDPQNPRRYGTDKTGYVEFRDVSFRYPGAEDDVLKNLTFVAKPGQTTAFIGSTGSGKSTLVNLIPRFYDVTKGQILVNDIDVREVTQHDLREAIGYVSQRAVLFSGTINTNIRYANETISDEDIDKFVKIAQAQDFIKGKGIGMEIAQGGTNLSGGQKQRLAIARALAKQPEIYIFDDCLSALDYRTDRALRNAMKKQTRNATVLIVTQRVSTIMDADQIVVLDDGEVAGIGKHRELLDTCDVYKEIALSQLSSEELSL
ncbi:MAG: ABC transporter ATP-binding protein [Dehalococcoidales bacterium]|nr:ABC transporter ATP-binding protein [Dehalococcoidales bacterium]